MSEMTGQVALPSITVLLSTFNGGKFLRAQLDSFLAQTYQNWTLFWRDDGSSDDTLSIMRDFTGQIGANRCVQSSSSGPHLGATPSFLRLLAETRGAEAVAFADQDDVWLPEKLEQAAARIGAAGHTPMLYCGRQLLVDEHLANARLSAPHLNLPEFPASLTQNIANGNTLVMNRAAAELVSAIGSPEGTVHDWWSYIVVSACGGIVFYDPEPRVLYRLHKNNLIGSARPLPARAIAAMQRGPDIFMTMMRRHVAALAAHADDAPARGGAGGARGPADPGGAGGPGFGGERAEWRPARQAAGDPLPTLPAADGAGECVVPVLVFDRLGVQRQCLCVDLAAGQAGGGGDGVHGVFEAESGQRVL